MLAGRKYAGHKAAYKKRYEYGTYYKRHELVSAGKLRKAKAIFEKSNENSHYITHTIAEMFNSSQEIPEEYLEGNREIKTTCYIVVTSCRGLCGGFNSNVLKEAQREIDADWEEPVIIAIGSRGKEYFQKNADTMCTYYLAPPENIFLS